jgi:hypothetical protein
MSPGQPGYADELPPVVHIAIGVVRASYGITADNALARLLIRAMRGESSVVGLALFLVSHPDRVEEVMGAKRPPH